MSDRHWSLLRNFPNTCDEETTRRGVLVPCEKPAVAARLDYQGHPYPVCAYHTRGDMVPLRELLENSDE